MIIYQASKTEFLQHAFQGNIKDIVLEHVRSAGARGGGISEQMAWERSLIEMAKVMQDPEIPDDAGVAIEYQLPGTSLRVDFIITGEDQDGCPKVILVELKQWSCSRHSAKDGVIVARRGGKTAELEGLHPCYQAWSYASRLQDLNAAVHEGGIQVIPCAYLHNHPKDGEIDHACYQPHIDRAPLFLKDEKEKFSRFISAHIRRGGRERSLHAIESSDSRPSKGLADHVTHLMRGQHQFVLIDDQKLAYEAILEAESRSNEKKQVVIIQGGPGTGKSVIAINLLAEFIRKGCNARYVSRNRAPRAVFEAQLTGSFTKSRIGNLFCGSGAFTHDAENTHDVLVVDEAHRLNEKSGLFRNQGDNQIREIMRSAKSSVFFIDNDQRVTVFDIGHVDELRRYAAALGAEITELDLKTQFRCNGSNGYLAWLDNTLDIRPTANALHDQSEYDFRVFDNPAEMHTLIENKNLLNNRARMVAGYCWRWASKRQPDAYDIQIPEFDYKKRWNRTEDSSLWIVKPGTVNEVGCIHTCQGLELDYIGVIIGDDLVYRNNQIVTDVTKRAPDDQTVRGLKKMLGEHPDQARTLADLIIKNTYRALMTRGMKGCYVYCTDKALANYLRSKIRPLLAATTHPTQSQPSASSLPLRPVTDEDRKSGVPAVPLIDIQIAAGQFSDFQPLERHASQWLELPGWIAPQPDMFIAQVTGESMNRRIRNGSWCLFKATPRDDLQGKIVIARHRSIEDPETGGRYTIKILTSERSVDAQGAWHQERITLRPDSTLPGYEPIVINRESAQDDFAIIAEFLTVL